MYKSTSDFLLNQAAGGFALSARDHIYSRDGF